VLVVKLVFKAVRSTNLQLSLLFKSHPTASPADTGKTAVCFFERQWPGAADLHVDRWMRPI